MKVLIVSGGMPTEDTPLNGNFEFDQAEALSNEGVDVTFFSVDLRSILRRRHWGISHGVKGKVKWYEISLPIGNIPAKPFCWVGAKALLYLYNRVYKNTEVPNIIHAHFVRTGFMASVLSVKTGLPLIITEHSSDMNKAVVNPDLLKYAIKGYSQAKQVISVGGCLSRNIKRNTGIESVVIPNMIHMSVFSKVKRIPHNGFRIVTTAGLIPLKRIDEIIEAVNIIRKKGENVYLDIIGDGPLKETLQSKVKLYDLEQAITLHGFKRDFEIAAIYEKSDCFVLASSTETFGVVYIEAMAAGLPVIATRCGGPEDFVNKQNGILIDVDNTDQLVSAIITMKNNIDTYDSCAIKTFVDNTYSPHAIAVKIMNQYNLISSGIS